MTIFLRIRKLSTRYSRAYSCWKKGLNTTYRSIDHIQAQPVIVMHLLIQNKAVSGNLNGINDYCSYNAGILLSCILRVFCCHL